MFLNATTRSLQISLGAAKATNDCPVVVDYVDMTTTDTTPGVQLSKTDGTTQVTILSAPAASTQRKVNFISIANADTDFVTVTVRLNDNGTPYNYVSALLLPPNATLQYTDARGWVVIDAGGNMVVATGTVTDIQVFTANGIWTRPANATYTQVDVVGGGGSGAGGQGGAAGTARSAGCGGGGGKRLQMVFLSRDLTDRVGVTVAASTPGGAGGASATGASGLVGNTSFFGGFLLGYGGGQGSASSGGGGGGGTGAGSGATGGPAFVTGLTTGLSSATDLGGASTTSGNGGSSYLGGGAGGGGGGSSGGSSFFSAAGGGSSGTVSNGNVASNGGAGGSAGGAATTAGGGGSAGVANTSAGGNGADGKIPGYCGQGGGGGGGNSAGTGFAGGNGGAPGGGGGGGGAGLTTGGAGGAGARGQVVVISW